MKRFKLILNHHGDGFSFLDEVEHPEGKYCLAEEAMEIQTELTMMCLKGAELREQLDKKDAELKDLGECFDALGGIKIQEYVDKYKELEGELAKAKQEIEEANNGQVHGEDTCMYLTCGMMCGSTRQVLDTYLKDIAVKNVEIEEAKRAFGILQIKYPYDEEEGFISTATTTTLTGELLPRMEAELDEHRLTEHRGDGRVWEWYCPQCKEWVNSQMITSTDRHVKCGCRLIETVRGQERL